MKPTSSQAHFELARIFRKSKDNKGAIKHLSEGIKIAPLESPGVYTSLARIYHKAKKTGKAVKILNKAIDIFPEEETAHVRVGLSNMLSAQGKYDQALKELQLALRINPNYAYDKLFQEKLKILKEKSAP
jgi:tetratricopeptide (TPR) repeat protein